MAEMENKKRVKESSFFILVLYELRKLGERAYLRTIGYPRQSVTILIPTLLSISSNLLTSDDYALTEEGKGSRTHIGVITTKR
jgi:hypothetical protein